MKANTDQAPRVAVVIPALNEAATIGAIVGACRACAGVERVVVVDDGSADATSQVAAEAGAELFRNATNRGKGASLRRGMAEAVRGGADLVATLDGDGQHRPADLQSLLDCAGAFPGRIVIGSRRAGGRDAPKARFIANRVADFWVSWAARHPVDDSQSGYRVYPAALIRILEARPPLAAGFAFESEVLIEGARLGFHTVAVDIPTIYGPQLRTSHFRPVSDVTRIVVMVGGKLLSRGMDPVGLWRSLRRSRR